TMVWKASSVACACRVCMARWTASSRFWVGTKGALQAESVRALTSSRTTAQSPTLVFFVFILHSFDSLKHHTSFSRRTEGMFCSSVKEIGFVLACYLSWVLAG